jgi:long-subunit acyl-CoA synthetase (AMP-forming)
VTDAATLPGRLGQLARERPRGIALREKRLGVWQEITWETYIDNVRAAAAAFVALGLEAGDRVAIHSENRPEWVYSDLAAQAAQGIAVGIYPTNPASEVEYLLIDSGARYLVAEDQEQVDKALEAPDVPALEKIIYIDPEGVTAYDDPRLISWTDFMALGRERDTAEPDLFDRLVDGIDPAACGSIVYTSGTTGPPKGAMLSHRNMIATSDESPGLFGSRPGDELLSYLPLSHVAEKIFTLFYPLKTGATVSFAESGDSVQENLREIMPTVFLGVPRIWEKMQASVLIRSEDLRPPPAPKEFLAARAASLVGLGVLLLWFGLHSFADSNNIVQRWAKYVIGALALVKILITIPTWRRSVAAVYQRVRTVYVAEAALAAVFLFLHIIKKAPSLESLALFLLILVAFIVPAAFVFRSLKWWNFSRWMGVGERTADRRLSSRGGRSGGFARRLGWLFLYRTVTTKLGMRRCRYALSGAAPVAPEVLRFLIAIGIPVVEGYGLTESTALGTLTRPDDQELGTVGTPVPSVELKLLNDGEICLRGPTVFMGYWNDPEATASAVDVEGWLHTGDVGEMTPSGHLRIIDRKKDIIITSGGKNLSPSEIENKLKVSPFIREAVVIGDRRKYLTALIGIEFETVAEWAARKDIPYTTYRDLSSKPEVLDLIGGEVDKANELLAQSETIKRFRLLPKELDAADAELTATQKVKRGVIEQRFGDLVAGMYDEPVSTPA